MSCSSKQNFVRNFSVSQEEKCTKFIRVVKGTKRQYSLSFLVIILAVISQLKSLEACS